MSEALDPCAPQAWLDYCLGETEAAMVEVKTLAAMAAVQPDLSTSQMVEAMKQFHQICEAAAQITTLRGRAKNWLLVNQEDDHGE